ncbi:MAG: ATP-NAD kinase family protein [Thermovirgaceae bacterium]
MIKVGIVVNPIAGMGGSVGLKGTDGGSYRKALELGAIPVTPFRTKEFLSRMKKKRDCRFYAAPGKMGADILEENGLDFTVVGSVREETSSEDTKRIVRAMAEAGIDLLVFAGGDGTARDVFDAIGTKIPVIGIPSGVKIFSSVFALSAGAAAAMLEAFVDGTEVEEEEVLDIDEDAFRENILSARLYGYLKVPKCREFLQSGKKASSTGTSDRKNKEEVARYLEELMEDDTLYLLGPGTTMKSLTERLDIPKTLLGIDAVCNKRLVKADVNEKDILKLFESCPKRKIIVTPLGGNGFIFGRGSKQFSPEVLAKTGKENVILAGDRNKTSCLEALHVDTGDTEVDKSLSGPAKVIIGYNETMILEVRC